MHRPTNRKLDRSDLLYWSKSLERSGHE